MQKLYGALRDQFRSAPEEDVQDAVGYAVVDTLKACQSDPPDNISGYLFTAAKNRLLRQIRLRRRLPIDEVALDGQADDGSPPGRDYDVEDLHRWFKRLVARWDNQRMRTVIEIVLDAVRQDITLTGAEIAEQAEEITGEEFSLSSVYEWRRRGLEKLAEEFKQSVERGGQGDGQDGPDEH